MSEKDLKPGRPMMGFGRGAGPHNIGKPIEKAKDFKGTLRRLLIYLKPYRVKFIIIFLAAVASTVFSIVSPKVMGQAITKLFEGFLMKMKGLPNAAIDFKYISNIILILIGLYVISAIFNYIQQYIMADVAQKTVYEMRKDINAKLSRLPLKYFDGRTHGEILSRVTNDVDTVSSTLQQSITQLITAIVTLVGIVVMMLTISPMLTLIALVTLPLSFLATKVIARQSQKFFARQQKYLGQLSGQVEEMYTGHKIVKVFNYEKQSIAKFNKVNDQLYDAGWKAQFISGIIMPLMMAIGNLGYVFIAILGGIAVIRGKVTIGNIQAFIQYSREFSHPIVQTSNIANIIQSTIAAAERVFEVLDETEQIPDQKDLLHLDQPKGDVKFEHIKFGYSEEKILIEDMSIDVKKGQTIAIVGPIGAGKTTLVNLLMRFYEINDGKITVDGIDIRDMERGKLRSFFGMVLQDTWLFKGSIKENIAYGREKAKEEEILQAAQVAYADHFIRTLPDGYDTILNEEANNISQGQKQLLTIARAILADPAILILDEATSGVDTRTEIHIQKAMLALMEGRTSFVIAHRLSTIRDADLILVMNQGSIIEKGTHQELLKQDGFYADLYNSQFVGLNLKEF
ncbi:MAG: ABC transporter ATP-binding protein [bacterium]|uniref:ABC transporter n=2 Tax=Candidatus Infernicultor aquiphilus TaxID=1805029 RepID=A0A1J5GHJ1_9BACT|nr:ABC transporter ATP-binding protein [bacterium]OIP71740.1 MAG: ABC transporter [Candidatus Atribacteria bacterium CG2_30_33_13]PIU25953.1 MAG: ABC transporter [Candidatus Atribacteria bacterium CG08_land_8_20_14_0_20_33_29]PIW12354.1 MAG: ABC transporter [Candidatus Atribacteria bacterium CG17_big_fil_post_rev_8_21_14_2_50_34_11]PJB57819.1 MAG: ABC transporter [Candidatus Atribacteria bacterium CG_4_9_14_3_um_filter_33_16]